MISQEEKDLINKYKEEGKTVAEIYKIIGLTYKQVYRYYNIDKISERGRKYREEHKEENKEYQERYRENHKEEIKEYQKEYVSLHKYEKKVYDKKYREEHIEEIKKYKKDYYEKNKEEIQKRNRRNEVLRIETDIGYKITKNLRRRISHALKGENKSAHTMELIGCSIEELKQHLENQFRDEMSWENYGSVWHIDHIIPCIAFDLTDEEQQKECFNYKNLQPLLVEENLSKNDLLPDGTRARYRRKIL